MAKPKKAPAAKACECGAPAMGTCDGLRGSGVHGEPICSDHTTEVTWQGTSEAMPPLKLRLCPECAASGGRP